MSSFLSTASVRGAARAFLITGLWLSLLLLSFRLTGSTFLSQSNVAFMESHLLGGMLAFGLAIFLITFGKFQPLKAIFSIARSRKDGDRGRLVINVGLSLAVILIVVALVTSLYQTVTSAPKSDSNLWRVPEVIAVAIGLILSVLFVDRWRSLEGKVDGLASDQSSRLKDIQQFSTDQIELKVGQVVDKAEKVSAKLASISEQNPWLEVVTERDIILETESVRGILRSAYNLLNEDKTLHLFEYLDFSSRKGTDADPRKQKVPLRGTADDFLEIASFCEIWLGDYALAVEFLHRYINQAGKAAYVIYPDLTRRLLRNGDLPRAKQQMVLLERVVRRQQIKRVLPFLDSPQPVSERYYWHACNVLAIAHAAIGSRNLAVRYSTEASAHSCASLFANDQILFQAERLAIISLT